MIRRDATGRAELLAVTGVGAPARLSASSFRFAVDRALGWNQIRSDWYAATVSGAALEMTGKGYGHGVGLCQAGAYEMAAEGHSAAEILNFYFPGTVDWHHFGGPRMAASRGRGVDVAHYRLGWPTTGRRQCRLGESAVPAGQACWFRRPAYRAGAAHHRTVSANHGRARLDWPRPGASAVFLQPATVRQSNGGTETLLLHEFLHVLVEQQAGEHAPLWLREGLVETLTDPGKSMSG